MTMFYHYHNTSIGELLLAGDGDYLSLLGFPHGKMQRRHEREWSRDTAPFADTCFQLDAYFAGELKKFDLPLMPKGTAFQESVWQALTEIPYGETWSYGQLAAKIEKPKASRAVGAANGMNPIPVIIPCHRVIGASGKLTGFGGGIETKQFLLELESGQIAPRLNFA
ncbi:MAG: methylated-DNA--[protein]-cysteine S-methyltransferase [Gammaproteobacteria bacterium]|nr:methylated-DNA--[protein]-cysteine S-methyltransferase [Gammaproteobacteria bacterium]